VKTSFFGREHNFFLKPLTHNLLYLLLPALLGVIGSIAFESMSNPGKYNMIGDNGRCPLSIRAAAYSGIVSIYREHGRYD
jgi:hypothetical protein